MRQSRFTVEEIIRIIAESELPTSSIAGTARKYGIKEATLYRWRAKYKGLGKSEAKRLKVLEDENRQLKRLVADKELIIIGFNPQGQLISQRDEIITLAKGSVFVRRDSAGNPIRGQTPDFQLSPTVNQNLPAATQTNTYQFVRVNWLTGRAKVELPEFH